MSAAETIAAAIERLEEFKIGDGGCVGPWQYLRKGSWGGESAVADVSGHPLAWVGDGADADRDAELIVTLHRTIDAQLALLNAGADLAPVTDKSRTERAFQRLAEDLARAILGGAA